MNKLKSYYKFIVTIRQWKLLGDHPLNKVLTQSSVIYQNKIFYLLLKSNIPKACLKAMFGKIIKNLRKTFISTIQGI